ncbi:MAG: pilus assembly protein [Acidobacteria bacterium]|nr:pilus assembly protein [Acidobacteriota bacterium]
MTCPVASGARDERGQALIEMALTMPLLLLLSVGVFEFGRAFEYWQVMTNAAREGARIAVLPGQSRDDVVARVRAYLDGGRIAAAASATVEVAQNAEIATGGGGTMSASTVTIAYPFQFIALQGIARLVAGASTAGDAFTMTASATMRNE